MGTPAAGSVPNGRQNAEAFTSLMPTAAWKCFLLLAAFLTVLSAMDLATKPAVPDVAFPDTQSDESDGFAPKPSPFTVPEQQLRARSRHRAPVTMSPVIPADLTSDPQ